MSTPALALEWNHSQCSPPSRSSCTHALPRQRGMRTSCMLNVSAVAAHGGWGTRSDSSWHPRHSGATNRAAGEDPTQAAANFLRKSAAAGHWAPAAWLQPTQQSCSGRKMRHCLADPLRQAAGQFQLLVVVALPSGRSPRLAASPQALDSTRMKVLFSRHDVWCKSVVYRRPPKRIGPRSALGAAIS